MKNELENTKRTLKELKEHGHYTEEQLKKAEKKISEWKKKSRKAEEDKDDWFK